MKKRTFAFLSTALMTVAMTVSCCGESQPSSDNSQADAVIANIMNRKSVRSYTNDTIPAADMEIMLRAAVAAPTGMDVRPWHLVVMTDKSKYAELFEGNFNMEKYMQAGAVVIFCADTTVTRPPRDNPNGPAVTTPNAIWRDDMGACTENFLLAAEALGYGAVWTACYPFPNNMEPIKKYLNLPGNIVPYSVVPVGRSAGDNQPKDKWNPERIHYNGF